MIRPLAVALLLSASSSFAAEPEPAQRSLTVDLLPTPLLGALLNTYGTFVEYQVPVLPQFSVLGEIGYLKSSNYKPAGGEPTGLRMDMVTLCTGVAWWLHRPLEGLFVSVRVEMWLAAAQDATGNAAIGNVFDANFQPGWQFRFGAVTVIASLSFAYASGPIRSPDGLVEFPIQGFSVTPHLRAGFAW